MQALALKYRPHTFDDVTEQSYIKVILQQQLKSNQIQHCYLFVGGAGTGKTTCARIFANEINKGQGNPIELDAASNNSVDDMRDLIQQAQTKSLNSEYKVFIVDECHMITVQGWNAILKLIEEPPAKSIFIFCTTDPQKIPKTILSRVQRYDFQRISQQGIVTRLKHICDAETREIMMDMGDMDSASDIEWARVQHLPIIEYDTEALEYLAKIADGGMRDAITLMDKCLAYSTDLTLENVVKALGTVDYKIMFDITSEILRKNEERVIEIVEDIHNGGKDIKRFIKQYVHFLLDIQKFAIGCDWRYISIPSLEEFKTILNNFKDSEFDACADLLEQMSALNANVKYSDTAKLDLETQLLLFMKERV